MPHGRSLTARLPLVVTALVLIATAAAAGWLLTARWLYGRWRAAAPVHTKQRGHSIFEVPWSEGYLAIAALIAGLLWPLVLVAAIVRVKPPRTEAEADAELAAMKARRAAIDKERQATEESTAALRKAADELDRELGSHGH